MTLKTPKEGKEKASFGESDKSKIKRVQAFHDNCNPIRNSETVLIFSLLCFNTIIHVFIKSWTVFVNER